MGGNTNNRHIDYLFMITVSLFYLMMVFIFQPQSYFSKMNDHYVTEYFHSQDIPFDVPDRIFLSDSQVYAASGYLYAIGNDPTLFNFQHPPLVKYLFGYSTVIVGTPLYMQLVFGIGLLILTYAFARLLTRSQPIAMLSTVLLAIDPVFIELSGETLLDVGMAFFVMLFFFVSFRYPKAFIVHGIFLGMVAASKFWSSALAIYLIYLAFRFIQQRKLNLVSLIGTGITAAIVFTLTYIVTFLKQPGFNLISFEIMSTFSYWLHHSVSSVPGDNILLFLTGYYHQWWGDKLLARADSWSVLWPFAMLLTLVQIPQLIVRFKKNTIEDTDFLYIFPVLYLLSLSIQAPFPRYFIILLPVLYPGALNVVRLLYKQYSARRNENMV